MCRKLHLATTLLLLAAPVTALAQGREPAPPAGATALAKATAAERAMAERTDPLNRAAFWNQQLRIDPSDAEAALGLSRALRALGQYDQAAATAQQLLIAQPSHRGALMEVARAKIAAGDGFYAIEPLTQARQLDPRDWQVVSLLGVAYEQVERYDDAWGAYQQALALSPENPSVLANMGMYLAARGQPAEAEAYLRRAAARPEATAQVRQNLAFVLGVQGKLGEAERLLRQDLPPQIANNNLAYLRAMNGAGETPSPRTWEALRGG